jgi:DNA-binding NtrC family response regulator
MSRILVVSHDPVELRNFAGEIEKLGHRPVLARGADEALDLLLEEGGIGALVEQLVMPERDGFAVLAALTREALRVPAIAFGARDEAMAQTALRHGAADVIGRIAEPGRLAASLALVLRMAALEDLVAQNARRQQGTVALSDIETASAGVERAVAQAARAARADMPVLIEGEAGVGKTLLARAIHAQSARAAKPFVRVDCAAIPPAELEARLFGRRQRGEDQTGAIAEAQGGTLYLRDIGSLPPALQDKLLGVLETGFSTPLGSPRPLRADVRLIASTRIRLLNLTKSGSFSEPLFYRLGVMPLYLPPLRDRREDLKGLTAATLIRAGAELGKPLRGLSAEAEALLRAFSWPGNVRELESTLYRAAALSPHAEIAAAALPHLSAQMGLPVTAPAESGPAPAPVHVDANPPAVNPASDRFLSAEGEVRSLAEVERDLIAHALIKYDHHMSRIARALGIGRSTLYRKLAEYGLEAAEAA